MPYLKPGSIASSICKVFYQMKAVVYNKPIPLQRRSLACSMDLQIFSFLNLCKLFNVEHQFLNMLLHQDFSETFGVERV